MVCPVESHYLIDNAPHKVAKTIALKLHYTGESPSLVLVINDTKLLMSCVKCFELGTCNTCDEGVCGKEWWPHDPKRWCMDMK
jgi:hypothetical protein